ncbi:trypsin-like peptidase domain-containing protein [Burkholderia sp. JPY481]
MLRKTTATLKTLAIASLVLVSSRIFAADESPWLLNTNVTEAAAVRLVHIHYVIVDRFGKVERATDGSAFLLDGQHAITAAHVVREAFEHHEPIMVQVGAMRSGNYLTTAKVERIDFRRDLAMLLVNTYSLIPNPQNAEESLLVPGAPELDKNPARVCSSRVPAGSQYALGGLAKESTGNAGEIEFHWIPQKFDAVLDMTTLPKLTSDSQIPNWNWHPGDPVLVLAVSANEGDSGGAVLSIDGCLMGITSARATIPYHDVSARTVTLAVPISTGDPFLKGTKAGQP